MIALSRPLIGEEEIEAAVEVLRTGMLAQGDRVEAFEHAFAAAVGVDHAVAVSSGTAALHIGLLALGIGPGDEVIVPSFTFAATANAVRMVGAEPVFVDVDAGDFTIHADTVARALGERTRAVIPVHLYGQAVPMTDLMGVTDAHGINVVEDAAQAHLATTDGRMVGSIGRLGAFSFYPTKNMTTGEGGMITTSDAELAERARMLRNQGMATRYVHEMVGLNERMTEIEAAVGLVQLGKLEGWTKRRRQIAQAYRQGLLPDLGLPLERSDAYHVYHQYTLTPQRREPVIEALESAGIGYGIYYPSGTHQQAPYRERTYDLPVTEDLSRRVVSIPIRPDLAESEVETIMSVLNKVEM